MPDVKTIVCGALMLAGLALAVLRPAQVRRALRDWALAAYGFVADLHEGMRCALAWATSWWKAEFAPLRLRIYLRHLLYVGAFLVGVWAEFYLLRLGLEVVLALDTESFKVPLLGQANAATLAAYSIVALTVLVMELLLHGLDRENWRGLTWTGKLGRTLQVLLAGLLVVSVCATQSAISVQRTLEMKAAADLTEEGALLELGGGPEAYASVPSEPEPPASALDKFFTWLPLGAVAFLGFLIPLVMGLAGASALRPTVQGAVGMVTGVPIALLALLVGMARLAMGALSSVQTAVESSHAVIAGRALPGAEESEPRQLPAASGAGLAASSEILPQTTALEDDAALAAALSANPLAVDPDAISAVWGEEDRAA